MSPDRLTPVAIIGGGFSGTMVAAQLARRGVSSIIVEGEGRSGQGTAYSTVEPAHLLNVRADSMSAWPDDPDDFARFVEREGGDPKGFAERRQFGRYMRSIHEAAVASGRTEVVDEWATSLRMRDGEAGEWVIELSDGTPLRARAVVLAIGNQPPPLLQPERNPGGRFVGNPWGKTARAAVETAAASDADVLILGTGLTMVDTVLSLRSAGHRGTITALSRRGLVPRSHSSPVPSSVAADELPLGSVGKLWRWIREREMRHGWRAAIDSLRPHSHRIWQSFGRSEQRRFLRHARPWWDVHRHRIAPEVAERIEALLAEGHLKVIAGKVIAVEADEQGVKLEYRPRGTRSSQAIGAAFAFNCTGPLGSIAHTRDPLVRQAIEDGIVRPDALGIGIDVDDRSRVVGADRLWALGPLTKGRYWEIIAVPDIRVQAAEVAEDIAMELGL